MRVKFSVLWNLCYSIFKIYNVTSAPGCLLKHEFKYQVLVYLIQIIWGRSERLHFSKSFQDANSWLAETGVKKPCLEHEEWIYKLIFSVGTLLDHFSLCLLWLWFLSGVVIALKVFLNYFVLCADAGKIIVAYLHLWEETCN